MSKEVATDRLTKTSARARAAEARGDDRVAGEEWRRYRLIKDAGAILTICSKRASS